MYNQIHDLVLYGKARKSEVISRRLHKRMHNLEDPLLQATFGIVSTYSNFKSIRYCASYKSSATKNVLT